MVQDLCKALFLNNRKSKLMANYCIKEGYQINETNITNDRVSKTDYWSDSRKPSADVYQFPVYKFVSEYIKERKITRLIDIGCGVANKLAYVNSQNPGLEIVGIDQDGPIDFCKKNYDFGRWFADDFENSSLNEDIKSELILSSDVIEHLVDPDLLLKYIKQRLAKGGVVILSTPDRDSARGLSCNHSPNEHHIREWNFTEFSEYLDRSGFEVIDHFLQYPIRFKLGKIFYDEIIKRILTLKPLKYNQLIVAKLK